MPTQRKAATPKTPRVQASPAVDRKQAPERAISPVFAPSGGKYRRYSDEVRATAVLLLQANGYPDKPGALMDTARSMGVPHSRLQDWYTGKENPPPPDMVLDLKEDLSSILEDVIRLNLDRARDPVAVSKTSAAQAMTTAAIAIDKQRLINGLPTEIVSVIPDYLGALRAMGTEALTIMQRTIERAESEYGFQRTITLPADSVRKR